LKEKSLGENCRLFLKLFGAKTEDKDKTEIIDIDDCIKTLKIERRRIYDIINILESFNLIRRLKKNKYEIKSPINIKYFI